MNFYMSVQIFGVEHFLAMGASNRLGLIDFWSFFFVDTCYVFLEELFLWGLVLTKVTVLNNPFTFSSVISERVDWNLYPADVTSLFLVSFSMAIQLTLTNHLCCAYLAGKNSGVMNLLVMGMEFPPLPEGDATISTHECVVFHGKFKA